MPNGQINRRETDDVTPEGVVQVDRVDLVEILDRAELWHRPVVVDGDLVIERLKPEELYRFLVVAAQVFPHRPQMVVELTKRVKVYTCPNETRLEGVRVRVPVDGPGKVGRDWLGVNYLATNGAGEELVTVDQREAWVHAAR